MLLLLLLLLYTHRPEYVFRLVFVVAFAAGFP